MSFWEGVGEKLGYGLAALIFGPAIAMKRSHVRTIRRAFANWLGEEKYTKQIAEPGRVRRLVERRDDELGFLLECELRPEDDEVRIAIPLEHVKAEELALEGCDVRIVDDKLVVLAKAPETPEAWNEMANGAVKLAAELTRRHRGDGYR